MSEQRDGFLDVVRALATIRVVLWHAFGAAALTFVAAMPVMFFVTGSLYAKSADRHGFDRTLVDRLRRVGPSLWVFGLVAWIAMAIGAWMSGTELPLRNVWFWAVPVGDPAGTPWEGGWLATPLWYLRTLLWIFLLAPLIIRAVRRAPVAAAFVSTALVLALDLVDRFGWFRPSFAESLVWQVGDVVLYAMFFAMGALARDGVFDRLSRPQWLAVAVGSASVAAVWWVTQPVPEGIVNNSHPMHLLVGLTWLALAMAARDVLRQGTTNTVTGPVVRFLSRRSLTVYLWHTSAIVLALWFVNRTADLPPGVWTFSYVVLITAGVLGATVLFGWVEDKAARRPARLWPMPLPQALGRRHGWAVMALPVAVVLLLALVLPTAPAERSEVAFKPRVPSQAPPRPQLGEPELQPVDAGPALLTPAVIDAEALQRVIDEWQEEYGVPGVSVAVTAPHGDEFIAAQGVRDDGEERSVSDQLDVMSITKLFTANLVYRAVDAGLLDLDAPIPALDAEPEFPYGGRMTVRQLLGHRSGIINYRDSSRYEADPNSVASVSDAISSSVADPLVAEPGSVSWYSSTNYLVLGRVLEQVTGIDYDELLFRELLVPLGLASAAHLPPDVGEPRYATAGLLTDIGDLGRAGIALLRDHVGVSDASYSVMLDIDEETGLGPGLNGFCPCSRDADWKPEWFGLGYSGGSTLLLYLPATDIVVAIDMTEGLYSIDGRFDAAIELTRRIAAMVSLPQDATEPV